MKVVLASAGVLVLVAILVIGSRRPDPIPIAPERPVARPSIEEARRDVLEAAPAERAALVSPELETDSAAAVSDLAPDGRPWTDTIEIPQVSSQKLSVKWAGRTKRLYLHTGQLYAETSYEGGKRSGVSRSWYENGQLASTDRWVEGDREGERLQFGEQGTLVSRGSYKAGYRHGPWETWFPNGAKQSVGTYKSVPEKYSQWREGSWTIWRPDGSIDERRTGWYEQDKLVGR